MRSADNPFTDAETHELARALVSGAPLTCPHCAIPLDRRSVPPRPDVSYVRDRVLVVCSKCHRNAVLDRREAR